MLVKIIDEVLYTMVTYPDVDGNVYFNPTPYGDGSWYITTEDVNNCTFAFFDFLKNSEDTELL
jgi:hypothetical protein